MPKAKPSVADLASQISAALRPQPATAPQAAAREKVHVSKATWTGTLVVAPGLAFKAKLYKAIIDPTEGFKSNMVHQCSCADGTDTERVGKLLIVLDVVSLGTGYAGLLLVLADDGESAVAVGDAPLGVLFRDIGDEPLQEGQLGLRPQDGADDLDPRPHMVEGLLGGRVLGGLVGNKLLGLGMPIGDSFSALIVCGS